MFEFDNAYLVKVRRDIRAAEFAESIRKPGHHTYELMITEHDEDALAIAIEGSTPDQIAKWIVGLVTGVGAFEDEDYGDESD